MIERGSFSTGATGSKTVLLNGSFVPTYLQFTIAARSGTTESVGILSLGSTDGTRQRCISTINNSFTKNTTSECITHYAWSAGAAVKKLGATFVSASAGQFTLNFTTADANYPIYFEAFE